MKKIYFKFFNVKFCNIINDINYQFKIWIEGNFEDDPLPYEVNYILFLFTLKNNILCLNLSGGERLYNVNQPLEYFPLEIQFFHCVKFYSFYKTFFAYKIKKNANNNLKKTFCFKFIKDMILNYLIKNKNNEIRDKNILLGYENEKYYTCINIQNNK